MSSMRYLPVLMLQVDKDGKPVGLNVDEDGNIQIVEGFLRYGIIDRRRKNRMVFSTKDPANNQVKLMSMMKMGEDDFNREDFDRKMRERELGELKEETLVA